MIQDNRGNIFALLFAAVALIGVVSVLGIQTITGPISTATRATQKNMIETHLMTNARLVIMNAGAQAGGGDVDGDGIIEPIEYVPNGTAGCTITLSGGGCLPSSLGAALTDPFGSPYGYCVWDHGAVNNGHVDGNPVAPFRLRGTNDQTQPVIALLSAGPDRIFQTTCHAFDGIGQDGPVKPVGSDDYVFTYTYNEALASSGGLWTVKLADPQTAEIAKDLEIKDGSGNVTVAVDHVTGIGDFLGITTDLITAKSSGTISLDGRVGIGTHSPDARLHVQEVSHSTSTKNYLNYNELVVDPPANSTAVHYGTYSVVQSLATNPHHMDSLRASYNYAQHNGYGDLTNAYGSMNYAYNIGSGNIGHAYGSYNAVNNQQNGNIANAYGSFNYASNSGATVSSLIGSYNYARTIGGASVNTAFATRSAIQNGTGTINSAYSFYANLHNTSGGTVDNYYAYYATLNPSSSSANNAYAFYADAPARSYFGGSVGIGATDPDARLTISASDKVTNQIMLRSHRGAIASGDLIGGIEYMSNDTNLVAPGITVGAIKAVAEAPHTGANLRTGLSFFVTNALSTSEALRISGVGNVGVGVSAPVARLDVDGYARLRTYSAIPDVCNAAREGAIAYSGKKYLCFCDGASWKQAHSPASACVW